MKLVLWSGKPDSGPRRTFTASWNRSEISLAPRRISTEREMGRDARHPTLERDHLGQVGGRRGVRRREHAGLPLQEPPPGSANPGEVVQPFPRKQEQLGGANAPQFAVTAFTLEVLLQPDQVSPSQTVRSARATPCG
jgi:hypothetical protein